MNFMSRYTEFAVAMVTYNSQRLIRKQQAYKITNNTQYHILAHSLTLFVFLI